VIDLHSHVLPGLDDGPDTLDESIQVLTEVAAEGVSAIAATPHVGARYPTTAEEMEHELTRTAAAAEERGIAVRLLSGGEVELEWLSRLSHDELRRFSLGGGGRYLLVELPWSGWPPDAFTLLERVSEAGLRPVIAHPERHTEIQERPGHLEALVGAGALLQVTASSLEGLHGRRAQKAARALLDFGMVHLIASDRHGRGIRRATMRQARRRLGDRRLADWLTVEVPAAVVAGEDLPARPPG
jgi:protein-tyrosine phosphatase